MKRSLVVAALVAVMAVTPTVASASTGPGGAACWGQATKVFAQTGVMGEHASEQPVPRVGLRNLARSLYQQGDIEDDSLRALGVFVTDVLGLSIDACA